MHAKEAQCTQRKTHGELGVFLANLAVEKELTAMHAKKKHSDLGG